MTRRLSLSLALVMGLSLVPGSPAGALPDEFTFYGAGWGHGIGMSQWGAYGLARQGWNPSRILKTYYRGVRVREMAPPAKQFRIGLIQSRQNVNLVATAGSFDLVLSSGRVLDTVNAGGARRIRITSDQRYRIIKPNGDVVGNRSWGGPTRHLRAIRKGGGIIDVKEWAHMVSRGKLEFVIVGANSAHLVAVLNPESYIYGIAEVSADWPEKALRVQAIAARTYAYNKVLQGTEQWRDGCACGLFSTTQDQFYIGRDKEVADYGERWVAAVKATRRTVIVHKGDPILAMYSSSSGGYTEHNENIWGGGPLPYLRGRCDPGDYHRQNVHRTWSVTLSPTAMASKLRSGLGWDITRVTRFVVNGRGVSGRIKQATIHGRNGSGAAVSFSASGWDLRGALDLEDMRFWVNENRLVMGAIRNAYDDLNCKPGLASAPARSIKGGGLQAFQQGRLYRNAAKGKVTWMRGPIMGKYLDMRGHRSVLGLPYRYTLLSGKARRARFDAGEIYWTSSTGAHEIHGRVRDKYAKTGWHRGDLGYPSSDVKPLDGGGEYARFQRGTITCPAGSGCTVQPA